MPKAKKFNKGCEITAICTLAQAIEGQHYVMYRDKPLHPNFVLNMSFGTVLGGIRARLFSQVSEYEKD